MTNKAAEFRDEIELIDILQVIWKWKYLILGCTFLFSLTAAIVSFQMTKVYRVDMILSPGTLKIEESGKKIYIDSPQNIQALIQEGTFDNQILKNIPNPDDNDLPHFLKFKVTLPKNSNTLRVSYETSNIDQGIRILESLGILLRARYDELVKYYHAAYETAIKEKQTTIENSKAKVLSYKENIRNIQKRIDALKSEIDLIDKNTISLIKERDKLLEQNNQDNILSSILYTSTIQQNLTLANTYKNQIKNYKDQKEIRKVKLDTTQNNIKQLFEDIKDIQFKRQNIQNVQILKSPISSPSPIKPKKKLIVMLAGVIGLFLSLFLAFFLEYISKYKKGESK